MNNYTHTADGSVIYYRSRSDICFRLDGSTVEDYISDNDSWKSSTDNTITNIQNKIKNDKEELINKMNAITADSLGAVKKAGDKMTGQLQKDGISSAWVAGRNNAFIRQTTVPNASAYCPILSAKSATGSWEMGPYINDIFHISHISDANYNTNTNTQTADFQFTKDGRLIASTFVGALSGKATSAGAADTASALSYFKNTSSSNVGLDTTDANAIGYVSGTSGIYGINDGMLIKQVYSTAWMGEIYLDYRTGQIATRGKNNGTLQAWRKQLDSVNYKTYCTPANIGAAASSHTHSGYAASNHTHSGYAASNHTHSDMLANKANVIDTRFSLLLNSDTTIGNYVKNSNYIIATEHWNNLFNQNHPSSVRFVRLRCDCISHFTDGIYSSVIKYGYTGLESQASSLIYGVGLMNPTLFMGFCYSNELIFGASNGLGSAAVVLSVQSNTSGYFHPGKDNFCFLGKSNYRWKQIYAATATISTSDRTMKKDIRDFDDDFVIKLIMALKPKTYKFKDNDSNRTHYGFIAQDIEDVFPELGINSKDIAAFIKSPNTRTVPVPSEKEGEPPSSREEVIPEGEEGYGFKYSLRYEEFISPLTRVVQLQQERLDEFEMQLKEKDDKISNLENTISSMMARLETLENMQN